MEKISIKKENIIPKIKSTKMFNLLAEKELDYLFSIGEIYQYDVNETVINEGEISPYLYVILSGSVTIKIKTGDSNSPKSVYICSIGSGDVIGEAAIFTNFKRTANVISNENLKLFIIEREKFFDFIKTFPNSGIKILMVIIYSLLNKLKEVNHELAFEREVDLEQKDIDDIINEFVTN